MSPRALAKYITMVAGAQLALYIAWLMLGGDRLFYFDPRLGVNILQAEFLGWHSSAPAPLSWLSALRLLSQGVLCLRTDAVPPNYSTVQAILSVPSLLFFLLVLVSDMEPAHGFSVAELAVPALVFIVASVLPWQVARGHGRRKEVQ